MNESIGLGGPAGHRRRSDSSLAAHPPEDLALRRAADRAPTAARTCPRAACGRFPAPPGGGPTNSSSVDLPSCLVKGQRFFRTGFLISSAESVWSRSTSKALITGGGGAENHRRVHHRVRRSTTATTAPSSGGCASATAAPTPTTRMPRDHAIRLHRVFFSSPGDQRQR